MDYDEAVISGAMTATEAILRERIERLEYALRDVREAILHGYVSPAVKKIDRALGVEDDSM